MWLQSCNHFSSFDLQILITLHHTTVYVASFMMVHILFTKFFYILCNVFPSTMYDRTMMPNLQNSKQVLNFNVTMLPTYSLELDYF